ncbi:hypothetical protein F3Y22_tig00112758pilonHSYRG00083 [Hibiscus syriacus]|uniref:Uncharacterized protein n=1 Tax=Hibiscus syriacus TaxID=106335 RepID=A0A6A2WTG3_HIBSY|nr:hypothetical protein F3Y22_tig00112758pilonHSYRG00083 [Hibiscus syriacus]
MNANLPNLGLQRSDCSEMSWAESTVYWAGFADGTSIDVLLNGIPANKVVYITKSDYYKAMIPKQGFEALWEVLMDTLKAREWMTFQSRKLRLHTVAVTSSRRNTRCSPMEESVPEGHPSSGRGGCTAQWRCTHGATRGSVYQLSGS